MAEHDPNDELSVEELEDVAGGSDTTNGTCPNAAGNCKPSSNTGTDLPGTEV